MEAEELKYKKLFYSIGEVAKMFNVNESLLRFWEKEFDVIKPRKNAKGTRFYKQDDIDSIRLVYHLVKEKKMTLSGAKQKIKDNKEAVVDTHRIIEKLKIIKAQLQAIKAEMDDPDLLEQIEDQNNEAGLSFNG